MRPLVCVTALGMCLGLLVSVPPLVVGQLSSLQEKIEKEKQTLEQLKQEIQETRKQRDRSQKKQTAVLQSIERLDRQYYKERREKAVITRDLRQIDRELKKIGTQLTALQSQINERKAMIETRLRRLYMDGQAGWFQPLLTANSYAQFQRRLLYVFSLATREHQLFEEHQRDLADIERLHEQQTDARQALLGKKRRIDKKLHVMKGIRNNKRGVLASLKRETLSHEHALSTLEQAEHRKESLLETLEQRSRLAAGTLQHTLFKKGALVWPAEGDLVGAFGRQRHPTFDTYINRKGIEIATPEGSAIHAVSDGEVVYADWLKGYGLVVILDHGNNYFTFYAHASELSVREGDVVAKGAVLGETGAFGLTDKPVLYFELRKGTKPVNPVGWFAKR